MCLRSLVRSILALDVHRFLKIYHLVMQRADGFLPLSVGHITGQCQGGFGLRVLLHNQREPSIVGEYVTTFSAFKPGRVDGNRQNSWFITWNWYLTALTGVISSSASCRQSYSVGKRVSSYPISSTCEGLCLLRLSHPIYLLIFSRSRWRSLKSSRQVPIYNQSRYPSLSSLVPPFFKIQNHNQANHLLTNKASSSFIGSICCSTQSPRRVTRDNGKFHTAAMIIALCGKSTIFELARMMIFAYADWRIMNDASCFWIRTVLLLTWWWPSFEFQAKDIHCRLTQQDYSTNSTCIRQISDVSRRK